MNEIVCDANQDLVYILRKFVKVDKSKLDKSKHYIDIDEAMTNPKILKLMHKYLIKKMIVDQIDVDYIACIESSTLIIAGILSTETDLPLIIVKDDIKSIVGHFASGKKALFLEGTNVKTDIQAIFTLRAAGLIVDKILTVVDSEENEDIFSKEGIINIGLVKLSDLASHNQ